ncbi:hypothetical protein [Paludisphaera soli]|uniref:hypothetical protein n=1 Tax=Paludisphaera soli TaxID=2712865 RepID=UPI0013E9E68A|nr:hypothetical protein [Paludisphaera soli]
MEEPDLLQENLHAIAADLLSLKRFQPVMRRIFAVPAGVWQTVASCCSGEFDWPESAAEIFAGHADQFVVTYLPWPGLTECDPGCMVVFVHGAELWSTVAYFNRATLSM